MPWQWEENLNRYRDADTGRFIAAETVRGLVDERQRITGSGTDGLAELLRGGQLNTRDWETGMREAIKDEYIQQYLLGRGGLSQMTQADWGSIGGMVADQYRYLDGFAREVAAGRLTEAQVAARSRMYINSGREAHERASGRAEEEADEARWLLRPADHCLDCIALSELGWQPREPWPFTVRGREAIPCNGATQCLTNCQCTVDYRVSEEEEAVEWRPTMTPAEAERWTAESAVPGVQYHGTSGEAAASIEERGFNLEFGGAGRVFGDGIYLTSDPNYAGKYAERRPGGQVLRIRVNVKNPYFALRAEGVEIDLQDMGLSDKPKPVPFVSFAKLVAREAGLRYEFGEWSEDLATAVTKWMQGQGYDAYIGLEYGIDYTSLHPMINVFDPRDVVVI